ncbi:MAG: glycosyltransferase family 4 protein [Solirubrobacteraceae bacterium]
MRVLLDITYVRRAPASGTGVYLDRLQAALLQLEGIEVTAVADPRRQPPAGGGIGSLRNALADQWWTQIELPRLARSARAELIHHPLPAYCSTTRLPQVITVHDLAFERLPAKFDRRYRTYARLAHRAAARHAAAVVCVSEATAADVRDRWGIAPERIAVAHHGPGQPLPDYARRTPTHFLYVGDDEPRKNLTLLLAGYGAYRAAAPEPLELVLAGSAVRSGPGVQTVSAPSAAQLAALYTGAAALVHPAALEGFGLTVLEAMSLATPVIAVDTPAAREVCGAGAEYLAAGSPDALAQALTRLAGDASAQRDLGRRGRERATQFSWAASAHRHLEAYSCALTR